MLTKCLIGLTCAALGVLLGMAIGGRGAPESSPPAAAPPARDELGRMESLQARIREQDKEIEELRARMGNPEGSRHVNLDAVAAILHDKNLSVAEKIRRIALLTEPQRSKAVIRLGAEWGARQDLHGEILQALKEESSAEALAVLGDILKCGGWRSPTSAEIDALESLYRESENPGRRAALLPALSLGFLDGKNPGWLSFVTEIVQTERSPRVLGRLAESCFDVDEIVADASVRARLVESLPGLHGDPAYATVLKFLQLSRLPAARVADLHARMAEESDPQARAQIVEVFIDLGQSGFLSSGGGRGAAGERLKGDSTSISQYMDIYRGTKDPKHRVQLIAISRLILRGSSWDGLLSEFAERETSSEMRAGIQRLREAVESGEMKRPSQQEIRRILGED